MEVRWFAKDVILVIGMSLGLPHSEKVAQRLGSMEFTQKWNTSRSGLIKPLR